MTKVVSQNWSLCAEIEALVRPRSRPRRRRRRKLSPFIMMNSLLHFPSFSGCRAAGARAAGTPLWRNRVHHR